jgi:predicted transcriptional regulator
MSSELRTRTAARPAGRGTGERSPVRSLIIGYLADNGASKVAEISSGVFASRDCVRYHLAALERASIVRSDISPGTREGCTPFYALAPERLLR